MCYYFIHMNKIIPWVVTVGAVLVLGVAVWGYFVTRAPASKIAVSPTIENHTRATPSAVSQVAVQTPENTKMLSDEKSGITFGYPDGCTPVLSTVNHGSVTAYDLNCDVGGSGETGFVESIAFYTPDSIQKFGDYIASEECKRTDCWGWRFFQAEEYAPDKKMFDSNSFPDGEKIHTLLGLKYLSRKHDPTTSTYVTYIGNMRIEIDVWGDNKIREISFRKF